MPALRLFIDADLDTGAEITLEPEQSHYLGRVLRLKSGDRLSVFNGEQGEFAAMVTAVRRGAARVSVGEPLDNRRESPLPLHLVQGISRGERMDFVVQKATELGVKRISPVLTDHSVVRLEPDRAAKRRAHWQKVAVSACEQSGRTHPPLVDTPMSFGDWLAGKTAGTDIDLVLRPGASTPLVRIGEPRTRVCLLVGPEGGLSPDESRDAAAVGFEAVSLGPRILRTETAALTAITIAQSRWGDLA